MQRRVLIVDDDRSVCELLKAGLGKRGFSVDWATSGADAFSRVRDNDFDALVTDLNMRGMSGATLCERVVADRPDLPVVVITAFGSLETATAAIRAGAYDFLTKPFELDDLAMTLDRAAQHRALRAEVRRLRRAIDATQSFEDVLGQSEPMLQLQSLLARVADVETNVLITGESGTGKEIVARAIHRRSARRAGPFVAINCAAVPSNLLESELFGHAKGAFTDARTARPGLFLQGDGGTIFLDEVGDLPLVLQPKLLRALQDRVVRPVGADREVAFDARIVAATNRDLEDALEQKSFREDLYYRLNVIRIALPPLRARGADVLLIAQAFVDRFAGSMGKRVTGLTAPAAERLLAYDWPGNVRELQNCVERAVALMPLDQITVEDLPERIRAYRPNATPLVASDDPRELVPMEEIERRYVVRVLEAVGGNKRAAAQILGFDRRTLYRKLERWGMADGAAKDDS